MLQEQDSSGAVSAHLLTRLALDETYRRTASGGLPCLLTDALGSVIGLTNATGAIRTPYSNEPFGKTVTTGDADTNPFAFTGRRTTGS